MGAHSITSKRSASGPARHGLPEVLREFRTITDVANRRKVIQLATSLARGPDVASARASLSALTRSEGDAVPAVVRGRQSAIPRRCAGVVWFGWWRRRVRYAKRSAPSCVNDS
jgi:hypothetical protein